jgi:Cu+-exporting ATPase
MTTDVHAGHRPQIDSGSQRIDLDIGGMTCAACASRIEKKLNRIEGVRATVNYATERAAIDVLGSVEPEQLIAVVNAAGYSASLPTPLRLAKTDEAAEPTASADGALVAFRQRLIVAVVLGAPVLVLSMVPRLQFRNWQWLCLVCAAPVATWAAWPFHRTAWTSLRHGEATMDTLVSAGVSAAFGWSTYALFFTGAGDNGMTMDMSIVPSRADGHHLYLEVASATVALVLFGRWLELRARRRSVGALRALAALAATEANLLADDGSERPIPASQLQVGDHFVVRPGERLATDGVVEEGVSAVDVSVVTGESVPVDVHVGDTVVGATINLTGRLVIRATRVGDDTSLAQITRLVESAQTGKAPVQRLADRVSSVFVPATLTLAVATLGWWAASTGSLAAALEPAVSVLIIACPCALGLATPTALAVGTGRGAQLGLLIRGPEVLEHIRHVDTVVLDKTGTLTTGDMRLAQVKAHSPHQVSDVVSWAAAVEQASEHPIGRAIVAADDAGDQPRAHGVATSIVATAGTGVTGLVGGVSVEVRRASPEARATVGDWVGTVVEVAVDGAPIGLIEVSDTVRTDSASGIAALRRLGVQPMMMTGDSSVVAHAVAHAVGIDADCVIADVHPADKVATVERLQREGRVVAMVGDGVNDAAALAQADLGVAMGSGTDVANEASDLTLLHSNVPAAADAIRLGRRTLSVIKGNLVWAFGYNVVAIPLAMAWRLSPVVASAAMAFSSVFVVSNSLRLRRFTSLHRVALA